MRGTRDQPKDILQSAKTCQRRDTGRAICHRPKVNRNRRLPRSRAPVGGEKGTPQLRYDLKTRKCRSTTAQNPGSSRRRSERFQAYAERFYWGGEYLHCLRIYRSAQIDRWAGAAGTEEFRAGSVHQQPVSIPRETV